MDDTEAMRREIGTREGDQLVEDAGEVEVRTAAATAARIRGKHERWAEEMRAAGWAVIPPGAAADGGVGVERHTFADGPTWDAGGHAHTYGMPCPATGCRWPVPGARHTFGRCPTCGARQPSEHPAVSGGGEVTSLCPDAFHTP